MAKKYEQIKQYLLENIQKGVYVPDRPIPPERELAAGLGVNRMTVRRAVEGLMYDGCLIRKKGSGTYLTKEKVRKDELISMEGGQEADSSFYTIGLHEMAQEKAGEPYPLRQQQMEALLCLKTTGDILNVKEGSPILQIKTWFYREADEALMLYCRSCHPGDSYRFRSRKVRIK